MAENFCKNLFSLIQNLQLQKSLFLSELSKDYKSYDRQILKNRKQEIITRVESINKEINEFLQEKIKLNPEKLSAPEKIQEYLNSLAMFWNRFYHSHDIRNTKGEIAKVSPEDLKYDQKQIKQMIEDIKRENYTAAMIVPPKVTVGELLEKLVKKDSLIDKADSGKPIYTDSSISQENLENILALQTKDRPYLFFYQDTPETPKIDSEGDTADELRQAFSEYPNKTGFGIPEYIIFLRVYLEQTGNLPDTNTWTWLLLTYEKEGQKSFTNESGASCLRSCWNPDDHQLYFLGYLSGSLESYGGGRPASSYYPNR